MNLPTDVKSLIRAFVAKFPLPQGNPNDEHWDETIRAWTVKLGQQAAFSLGPTWGLKRASSTRPIGKDSLAHTDGPHLYSWDLLIGAGTGSPKLADEPTFYDLTGTDQVFEPAEPHDHLGAGTTPTPVEEPNTGDGGAHDETFAAFVAFLNEMTGRMATIQQQQEAIYQQNERIFQNVTAQIQEVKAIVSTARPLASTPMSSQPATFPTLPVSIPSASQPTVHLSPETIGNIARIAADILGRIRR